MSEELTRSGEGIFKPSRRGYDRVEVDAYVAQLHRRIHELQARVSSPDVAVRSALERVGGEVAAVLQQAHDTADEIIAEAEAEAAARTAAADRQAAEVTAAADEHAAQVTAAADRHVAEVTAAAEQRVHELDLDTDRIWSERERIMTDARDLSRQLQAVADLAAERFPEDQHMAAGDRGFGELNASN
jgi:DivIVA domain-containing protein